MFGIRDDAFPVRLRQPHRKLIWIKYWPGHHCEDFAGVRVHGDNRTVLALQRFLRSGLHIQINRESQVLAWLRQFFSQYADLTPVAVHDQVTRPVNTPQQRIVCLLHAALAHHVTGLVERIFRQRQILLADFAHVPNQVRSKSVPGVQTPLFFQQFQFRQLIPVRLNKRLLIRRDVYF